MLQLPVIVVLVVSMFVGRVSPVLQKERHEESTVDVAAHLTDTTNISSNSSSEAVETSIKTTEDKKKVNEINVSVSSKSPPDVDPTTSISVEKPVENEKQNCTSTKEQVDMLECHVTPQDDDDITEQNTPLNTTEPTISVTTASNKTEANAESQVPKITPSKDKENDGKKEIKVVLNTTHTTDRLYYDVHTETDHPMNANHSDVPNTDSKHGTNTSEVSTAPPLLVTKIGTSIGSKDIVGAVKSADQVKNKRMSSGLIALVTAISFAIVIALMYVGMIIWRRYIEYRYGHRELLVNELEFDTNDLRHFEL